MNKKFLLLLPTVAALMLTGCGSTASSTNTATDTATSQSAGTITAIEIKAAGDVTKIPLGGTLALTANVTGTGTFSKLVTWASSDSTIATVSVGGVATGVKAGSVKITATSQADSTKVGEINLTVADIDPVKISTIAAKGTAKVQAIVTAVTKWGYMLDDGTGAIYVKTAEAPTVKLNDYVEVKGDVSISYAVLTLAEKEVTVLTTTKPTAQTAEALTSEKLSAWAAASWANDGSTITLATKDTKPFSATVIGHKPTGGNYVELYMLTDTAYEFAIGGSSYPDNLPKISEGSKYNIVGYCNGWNSKNSFLQTIMASVEVAYDDPTSVAITASADTVVVGETVTLTAAVTPASAKQDVTWSVANKDTAVTDTLATIADTGVLTGVAVGTVVVTAASVKEGVVGTKEITVEAVKPNPTAIALAGYKSEIAVNGTTKIGVTYTPSNAKPGVKFESSDATIASVDATGLVTGLKVGSATITVTSTVDSTISATAVITVLNSQNVAATNLLVGKAASDPVSLTGVYAMTSYDATVKGFLAATKDGVVYIYDGGSTKYCTAVVAGKYYDIAGTVAIYKGTYELAVTSCAENTTVEHFVFTYANTKVLDFGTEAGIADAVSFFQGLVGKTDAQVAAFMGMVTIKNAYFPAISNGYSYLQAVKGTAWSTTTSATTTNTIKVGYYAAKLPESWIGADALVNYQGFFYGANNPFSAGLTASTTNIICRLAGGEFTAA